jgi:Uma2 family endonuclease
MSEPYEEIMAGEVWLRTPPGRRHEAICAKLHDLLEACLADTETPRLRLLPPRTIVEVKPGTMLRPDLALLEKATGRLWLAAEVIDPQDHRPDTVAKKAFYEEIELERLWMIDPRYDNIEVYQSGEYGLALTAILAGQESLTDGQLPKLSMTVEEVFAAT